MKIVSVGHALFAATMIAIGLDCLILGGFGHFWTAVPKDFPARNILAIVCGVASLATGVGLFWRRTAPMAARLLVIALFLWMLVFKGRVIALAPASAVSWEQWGETAAVFAAAWVLYIAFAEDQDRRRLAFATGKTGLRIARAIFGLAMIAFGVAHLAYVTYTAAMVPSWLPLHTGWVYLTGFAYIAAGLAIGTGVLARLAAWLVTLQIGLFTLLVWGPVMAAGPKDPTAWSETVVSWTLTVGALVVAESFRGSPWLANRRR